MNKNIELSVLMPVYNGEKYLKESIESILTQTYREFEFIIINDGSTDKSLEIIEYYSSLDNRIKVISRENKGLVYSLNEGVKLSTGRYIARMDADDISYKDRFQKQIDYLLDNQDVYILGTFVEAIGNSEKKEFIENYFNQTWDENSAKERIKECCMILHPTAMIKREALIELKGYRNKYNIMEDDDLWIRAFKKGYKISNYSEVLLKYRLHNESKSNTERDDSDIYLKQKINMRLEGFFNPDTAKDKKMFIWGCGYGGKVALNTLKENGIEIYGFIDSYKTGTFMNTNIYGKEILNSKNSYVFIATTNGFQYAKKYLNDNNIQYVYIV